MLTSTKTHIPPHCAVCGGPYQENGEPRLCEFCPVLTAADIAVLADLPAHERGYRCVGYTTSVGIRVSCPDERVIRLRAAINEDVRCGFCSAKQYGRLEMLRLGLFAHKLEFPES